jgi:hypothetical protein
MGNFEVILGRFSHEKSGNPGHAVGDEEGLG